MLRYLKAVSVPFVYIFCISIELAWDTKQVVSTVQALRQIYNKLNRILFFPTYAAHCCYS